MGLSVRLDVVAKADREALVSTLTYRPLSVIGTLREAERAAHDAIVDASRPGVSLEERKRRYAHWKLTAETLLAECDARQAAKSAVLQAAVVRP